MRYRREASVGCMTRPQWPMCAGSKMCIRDRAKPKMTVKNGVVYGDALSAQEKKRIVMQKKKDRKAKKVRKAAQQTRCV